jgi:hypothetical protein
MDVLDRYRLLVMRYTPGVGRAEAEAVLAMLEALKVRPDDWRPEAVYDRAGLSLSWAPIAPIGKDVKDVLLARQMEWDGRVYDSDGFTLKHAVLPEDPYTGRRIVSEQVEDRSGYQVQLDHVVSLSDAFRSGGWRWKPGGRSWPSLYNWDGNILAVPRSANASKGDKNTAQWLPNNPAHDFRQRYIVIQIQTKTRYNLSVTDSERTAMRQALGA